MLNISRRSRNAIKIAVIFLLVLSIIVVSTTYSEGTSNSLGRYKEYMQNFMETYTLSSEDKAQDYKESTNFSMDNNDDEYEHDLFADKENVQDHAQKLVISEFFEKVFQNIIDYSPTTKSEKKYKDSCPLNGDIGTRPKNYKDWDKLTGESLGECLEISDEELRLLEGKHEEYVASIHSLNLKELKDKDIHTDNSINSHYTDEGIVMVGGDKYSLLTFLSIKVLRQFNTTLPIEVFIPSGKSYETEFCNELLPTYNAKCIYLTDILTEETAQKFHFEGYQYKSLAIVISSFKNVLLLDADNLPITNLDHIFESKPFVENGLILWPDFWRRTTSPKFYDIVGSEINLHHRVRNSVDDISPVKLYNNDANDLKNIPFHDFEGTLPDMSTESGQLMINKSKHMKSILLALYYNFNGPSWYYSIFSQRASGEGDKETFIAGAHHFNLPYYQVRTGPGVDGHWKPDSKDYRGIAILQHNFIQDYERYEQAKKDFANSKTTFTEEQLKHYTLETFYSKFFEGGDSNPEVKEVDIMFIHANYPKFDPVSLSDADDFTFEGNPYRSYSNLKRINNFDIELEVYTTLKENVCLKRVYFPYIEDLRDRSEEKYTHMCKWIADRVNHLKKTHKEAISKD